MSGFVSIFESNQNGNHLQEDLAKFGYGPNAKVDNFNNPFIFWLLAGKLLVVISFINQKLKI
jgi:hypothetical protein